MAFEYSRDEMLKDYAVFVRSEGEGGAQATGASLQTRVGELETEVGQLKEQLAKAKGINDTMWETVVQRLVAEGKEKQKGQDSAMQVDGVEEERAKKRGRI